jgi:hypothetical protein
VQVVALLGSKFLRFFSTAAAQLVGVWHRKVLVWSDPARSADPIRAEPLFSPRRCAL